MEEWDTSQGKYANVIHLTQRQPVNYVQCQCGSTDWKLIKKKGTGKVVGCQCSECECVAYFDEAETFEFELAEDDPV